MQRYYVYQNKTSNKAGTWIINLSLNTDKDPLAVKNP